MPAPVAPSPIATPPDAPLRSDPTTFAAKREAWLAWEEDDLFPGLNTAVAYVDDGVAWVDLQVIAVAASASTATGAASAASTSAGNALTSENNASASAAAAAGSASTAAGFIATSVSSLAIGTGTKVFAVGTGKSFQAGEYILAADQADPANYMHGLATGYTGGNLTVNVTSVGGSGTIAAWNVALSAPAGPTGAIGPDSPPGTVMLFAASSPPTGYLKANGAAVSRAVYATLFTAIGTTFGAGDGSTTFLLPDLRGEFVRGWDDSRGADTGRTFGSAQTGQVESHTHSYQIGTGGSAGGIAGGTTQASTSGLTTGSYGTGSETRPRNIALLACIKY